jgi:hypothetical protein
MWNPAVAQSATVAATTNTIERVFLSFTAPSTLILERQIHNREKVGHKQEVGRYAGHADHDSDFQ